jgi:hypothetical protein
VTRRGPWELVFALGAVAVLAAGYALLARHGAPRPGGLIGLTLGIVGFALMLCTETLYSLRKRWHGFNVGPLSVWLRWHVFTGIVGPCLVLLHSAGRCRGLAGVLLVLTAVMLVSGFIGRYIYTAVPRTLDGAQAGADQLQGEIARVEKGLQTLGIEPLGAAALALAREPPPPGWQAVLGRPWLRWRRRRRLRQALRKLRAANRTRANLLARHLTELYRLQLQMAALAAVRRLMSVWHALHVPLGGVVFTLAFLHVGGALYYSTLLK